MPLLVGKYNQSCVIGSLSLDMNVLMCRVISASKIQYVISLDFSYEYGSIVLGSFNSARGISERYMSREAIKKSPLVWCDMFLGPSSPCVEEKMSVMTLHHRVDSP